MFEEMGRQQLLDKKRELSQRLQKIERDLRGALDADFAEQAVQLENRDVLNEIARVTREEIRAIDRALAELD